jgi:hypothetical protein
LIAVAARLLGLDFAYLPALAMRRITNHHPDEQDQRPRRLRDRRRGTDHASRPAPVRSDNEALAGLRVLLSYDDDLAAQSTRSRTPHCMVTLPWDPYPASVLTALESSPCSRRRCPQPP